MARSEFDAILSSFLEEKHPIVPTHDDQETNDNATIEPVNTSTRKYTSSDKLCIETLVLNVAIQHHSQHFYSPARGQTTYRSIQKKQIDTRPPWTESPFWGKSESFALERLNTVSVDGQLPRRFSRLELKRFYRKLALLSHPDRDRGQASVFMQVHLDYQTLMAFLQKIT